MNLTQLIQDKVNFFTNTDSHIGLTSVITHIESAERHLDNGKQGEDYLFTDTIYRTNQAFEGALKEAYSLLTGQDAAKKTPYQIEQYLENEQVLEDRVLALFSNYRKSWRNQSTHNYKLYFSEQEAFLAIVSICAFFNILLDQMIEKNAYQIENTELENDQKSLPDITSQINFAEQIVDALKIFPHKLPLSKNIDDLKSSSNKFLEREIIGRLHAYLNSVDKNIKVTPEFRIQSENYHYRPDLLLQRNEEELLVEVKRSISHISRVRESGKEQMRNYLRVSRIKYGIVFIFPLFESQKISVKIETFKMEDKEYTIFEVFPQNQKK